MPRRSQSGGAPNVCRGITCVPCTRARTTQIALTMGPPSTPFKEKLTALTGRISTINVLRPEVRLPLDGEWKLRCSDRLDDDLGGGFFLSAKGGTGDDHDCCGLFASLPGEPLNSKPVYRHATKERFVGWSGSEWIIAGLHQLADIRSGTIPSPFGGFHSSTGADSLHECRWESLELCALAAPFTVSAGKFEQHGQHFCVPTGAAGPIEFTWLHGISVSLELDWAAVATATSLCWSTDNALVRKVYWERASSLGPGDTQVSAHQRLLSDWRSSWEALKPALEELRSTSSESDSKVVEMPAEKEAEAPEGAQTMEHMCINLGFRMLGILMLQGGRLVHASAVSLMPVDSSGAIYEATDARK